MLTLASVSHMRSDVSLPWSLAVHAVVASTAMRDVETASALMLMYMTVIHVPSHYRRVLHSPARDSVPMCLMATVCAAAFGPRLAAVPDWAQRIATVHALLPHEKV